MSEGWNECQEYTLGQKIAYQHSYALEAGDRFRDYSPGGPPSELRAVTNGMIFEGFVVGMRNVIMETTRYHGRRYDESGERRGKHEWVLLVARDMRSKPVLVRPDDVRQLED
jgi:hypothetical protein